MQNRYAADVGDFGKFGILRILEKHGLKVGVNWYLAEDETHNQDGKHIGYLHNKLYDECDDDLRDILSKVIESGCRSVYNLEASELLNTGVYYNKILNSASETVADFRKNWHNDALSCFKGCDIIFLDPDNGLLPKSVSGNSKKSVKYVFEDEIADYLLNGYSVVFYNHRTREKTEIYLKRFEQLFNRAEIKDASKCAISFVRGTIRDYIFIIHPEHKEAVENSLRQIMSSQWNKHFRELI